MARKAVSVNLEQSLDTLESLVEQMESGDLTLEESLKAFEQGVKLTRDCQQALKAAEQRVRVLMEADEDAEPEALQPGSTDD